MISIATNITSKQELSNLWRAASRARLIALAALVFSTVWCVPALAQDILNQVGAPTFATPLPVELGVLDASNGNMTQAVPLGSFPQRGGPPFIASLVHDTRIWQVVGTTWQPTNISNSWGGWRFVTSATPGTFLGYTSNYVKCSYFNESHHLLSYYFYSYYNYRWAGPDGSVRTFPITTSDDTRGYCGGVQSSGDARANDSSGYHMYITGFSAASVIAPDGSQIFPSHQDTNGNYFSTDANGNFIDTLGRTPVTVTTNCNGNSNQICYDVLNSQGTTSRYTVSTTSVSVSTAFGQSGVTEYSGSLTVVQKIALPDQTYYQFGYDSYGELNSVTLPTLGQITYGYTNFQDSFGNHNRWLTSRASGGGTWSYTPAVITTCAPGGVGCQQKVTVTKPSADNAVYTFTLNNGAWASQVQYYTGAISPSNLAATLARTLNFSNPCSPSPCTGNNYIQKMSETLTLPVPSGSSISKTIQYTYDSISDLNVTSTKEWRYYSGAQPSVPDRQTDVTYSTNYGGQNILNRPLTSTVCVPTGTPPSCSGSTQIVAQTNFTYDGSGSLVSSNPATGIANHNAGYGISYTVRGNLTQVQRCTLLPGCSSSVQTKMTYDTTGQVVSTQDPNTNTTTLSYTDNFFQDNGLTPPSSYTPTTPTNAYVTQITLPLIGAASFGYYFNTGKMTYSRDQNNADNYFHFIDPLDRQTLTLYPLVNGNRGWALTNYTATLQQDFYSSINDTQPSTNCVSCRHDGIQGDSLGRLTTRELFSDPIGPVYVSTNYDSSGRVQSVSNPFRTTSDPTYGLSSMYYDGLGRTIKIADPDGTSSQSFYGASVSTAGGVSSQSCSTSTYGVGYPVLATDEASKKRQVWSDGFGRVIEVDEPDPSNNNTLTLYTCYLYDLLNDIIQVSQGTQTRSYAFDPLSRMTSATTPEAGTTNFYYTTTTGSLCSGDPVSVCRRVSSLNVTTTYTYDVLNRLTSESYSDGTATVTYYYDQTTFNGLTINGGLGRRTGMSDGSGLSAWNYDPLGHVLTERRTIAGITKTVSYSYTVNGLVSSIAYPSGNQITYTYNNAAQLISAVDSHNTINYGLNATYSPQGAVSTMTRGSVQNGFTGITESYGFNSRLQPTSILASSTNGTALSLSYGFTAGSNDGNIASETNGRVPGRSLNFTYDGLDRVATAQTQATSGPSCWGEGFGYDRWANLLTVSVSQCSAYPLSVGVNGQNHITNQGFTYDQAGRMTNDGSYPYGYDAENRINSAAGITYTYDGNGFRSEKSNGTLYWRNVGGDVLSESDLSGNITLEYIYFAGSLIATRNNSGNVSYYFADRLGNTRVGTDSQGNICFDSDYYPFGGEVNFANSCPTNYKFTGYERDPETSLDYALYRFYDSRIGRFTSPDPIAGKLNNPQSLNRYNYALDNPSNATDPSGMATQDEHEFLTWMMAALIGRPDAASIAQGAGTADNFFNATTGLFGLGYFINFDKHFGIPCTDGGGCASGGFDLGFQLHDVEDIGADGPHDLQGSYSLGARILDSLEHIGLNIIGKSPDRDEDRVVAGMQDAFVVLSPGNKTPFPWDAVEFIVETKNADNLVLVGMQLIKPGQDTQSYGNVDLTGATKVASQTFGNITVNIFVGASVSFYDSAGVESILNQFSLPGSDPAAEGEAIYNYQLLMAGFIFFPNDSWFCDASSGSCGFGGDGSTGVTINILK